MYYPCSENKGADQLRGNSEADLRLCFRPCKLLVFSCTGSDNCRLDAEQLVSCVANKANLRDLNIEGCKGIPPVDLDEKILPIVRFDFQSVLQVAWW